MNWLQSSKSSSSGSDTPSSTRPPSYTSERLPRYSSDESGRNNATARATASAGPARTPLTVIDETPEVTPEKTPFAGYGSAICLILTILVLNALIWASTWFITAIKLQPWRWAYIAEHKEKYLLAIWIPAVLFAVLAGLVALGASAPLYDSRKYKQQKSGWAGILFFPLVTAFVFGPFIGSIGVPMAIRVNYFKPVCNGMDTRIEIDASRISPYQFRPQIIFRDQINKTYKYPVLTTGIDGSPVSTLSFGLTPTDLLFRQYYDTYTGGDSGQPDHLDKETYQASGLPYTFITYNWTAGTWATLAADETTVVTKGTFREDANGDLWAPELGIYIPDWARVKRNNVYDAYVRIFQNPAVNGTDGLVQSTEVAEAFKKQGFRSNSGVLGRVASFAQKKNTVEMCALRRPADEVKGTKNGDFRLGLGEDLPVVVGLVVGMRENEWKAGRRHVKSTQVI